MERIYLTLISTSLWLVGSLLISCQTNAQVTSDGTLDSTVTSPDGNNFTIEGGTRPNGGDNLFHSFRDFSVTTNGSAVFNNANDITNIISRVTGGNLSDIDGLIKANGNANLFLINPAGILFRKNARLDIGGSFFGSTADSLLFPEGEFSAVDTQTEPLLTINIPIGLRFRDNPAPIVNRSFVFNNTFTDFVGLEVLPGENITLVGGDINFEGGQATAPGGSVNLGGLSAAGIVTINDFGSLSFPEGIARADVTLTNGSDVDVRAGGGGSITVNAGNIELSGGDFGSSRLRAGIAPGLGSTEAQAGDITLNATDAISLSQGSGIFNQVEVDAVGSAGDISITARSFSLANGAVLNSSTFGNGDSGKISISTEEAVTLDGAETTIFNNVEAGGVGDSQGIEITAESLSLTGGAQIQTSVQDEFLSVTDEFGNVIEGIPGGVSNGGDITINVRDFVNVSGVGEDNITEDNFLEITNPSAVTSTLGAGREGSAGDISITARSLSLANNANIDSSTFGNGDSGKISIQTDGAVTLDGVLSIIFNNVENGGVGDSQGIEISAESLSLTRGAQIQTSVQGESLPFTNEFGNVIDEGFPAGVGNGGDISITARSFSLANGANIDSSTFGNGDSGKISISTEEDVTLDGAGTTIFNNVEAGGVGDSQGIEITAESLSLTGGAQIQTLVQEEFLPVTDEFGNVIEGIPGGVGNGGDITINVRDFVNVSGVGEDFTGNNLPSAVRSTLGFGAEGSAGDISITRSSLSLANGANIDSSTFGNGDSGKISISTEEDVTLDGFRTGIFNIVEEGGVGDSQGIEISAESLSLRGGAQIQTSVKGELLRLPDEFGNSVEGIPAGVGNAGDISITASSLSLANGANIDSSTSGNGDSGKISISTEEAVTLDGFRTGIFNIVENGGVGNSQGIEISAESLSLTGGAQIQTLVQAQTRVREGLFRNSREEIPGGVDNAGDITINVRDFVNVSGFTEDNIPEDNIIILPDPSAVRSTLGFRAEGSAGDISIRGRSLILENTGVITNSTSGIGDAGDINIKIDEEIALSGFSSISNSVENRGLGNGGNLSIQAKSLTLTEGSRISTVVRGAEFEIPGGEGEGGILTITATDFVELEGVSLVQLGIPDLSNDSFNTIGLIPTEGFSSGLFAATERGATGDGGTITVTTDVFRIADGAVVDNSTSNNSDAGNITINANTFEATGGGQIITATRGNGDAANIQLNITDKIFISGSDSNFDARLARAEEFGEFQGGDRIVTNQGAASGIFANTSIDSEGDGGNINIGIFREEGNDLVLNSNQFTPEIVLANGARITTDSQGEGSGGAISIQAQDFTLENQAEILAETRARQDDNNAISQINLGVANILQLQNDSRISTQAVSNADGGNINIDAQFIIAFPSEGEGSDILTRAAAGGAGGDINITAEGIFGLSEGAATPGNGTNDIDASSQLGLNGNISVNTPTVDPTTGLLELTEEVVDAAELVAQNVCTQTADSEFVNIGKGGLPKNPEYMLAEDAIEVGLVAPVQVSSTTNGYTEIKLVQPKPTRQPPAQGWIFLKNGIVELVAHNPNQLGEQRTWGQHRGCQ